MTNQGYTTDQRHKMAKTIAKTYFDAGMYAIWTRNPPSLQDEITRPNTCILCNTRFTDLQKDMDCYPPIDTTNYPTGLNPAGKQMTALKFLEHLKKEYHHPNHYLLLTFIEQQHPVAFNMFCNMPDNQSWATT